MTITYTTKNDDGVTFACFTGTDGSVFEVPVETEDSESEIQTKLQNAVDYINDTGSS